VQREARPLFAVAQGRVENKDLVIDLTERPARRVPRSKTSRDVKRRSAMRAAARRAETRSSSILRGMVGSMFMRVNSKCAHQARPPLTRQRVGSRLGYPDMPFSRAI